MAKKEHLNKLVLISVLLSFFIVLAGLSAVGAQDQQKLLDDELLRQLFVSAKETKADKDALIKKINSLAKRNFDEQYKIDTGDVELEGIYELANNCYVTCHTAHLPSGEEVFLFHAHIFNKLENSDIQIHGRGKEDLADFGKFMMMSESGKIKFIRTYFKTTAKIELPS
ncbi:MAG TPA: hypothetical protein VFG29_02580 [Syntrophales bacterium]|nr:hypothetical protein [Syntrophales bacterium]